MLSQPLNYKLVIAFCFSIGLVACEKKKNDPPPSTPATFNGVLSFNLSISSSPTCGEALSLYTTEYQSAYTFGARGAQTAAPWSSMEDDGTVEAGENADGFDLAMVSNSFFGLNAIDGYGFTHIFFNLPSLTHTGRKIPSDISGLAFNHATIKTRYRRAIDNVQPYLNDSVKYFSLGNEVDSYLKTRPAAEWTEYKELIEDARTYLKSLKPNIIVGVTTTFEGFSGTESTEIADLNTNMDAIFLTYYPISGAFVADNPGVVSTDFATMVTQSGSKAVIIQEIGYPTSATNSGSEANQATFISNVFDEWKQRGSTKFPFISFFKRRDWNACECAAQTSGGSAGQPFYEFMCSLGILNNNSAAKSANATLVTKMSEIGIPN
ncbi:MAG: hypothetical protein AB7N80_04730 [Bdellovibrionales bacterium]